jgi:hypothetical protein
MLNKALAIIVARGLSEKPVSQHKYKFTSQPAKISGGSMMQTKLIIKIKG